MPSAETSPVSRAPQTPSLAWTKVLPLSSGPSGKVGGGGGGDVTVEAADSTGSTTNNNNNNNTTVTKCRRLDTIETFFKFVSDAGAPVGREHWAITLSLRLNFPDHRRRPSPGGDSHRRSEDTAITTTTTTTTAAAAIPDPEPFLRRAWQLIGRLHPALTGSVSQRPAGPDTAGKTAFFLTVEPFDPEAWASQTFFAQTKKTKTKTANGDEDNSCHAASATASATSSNDLFAGMLATGTATCHWLPSTNELFIRSPHWRIDGIGMLMLGHSFMEALASVLSLGLNVPLESYTSPAARGVHTPSLDDVGNSYVDEATTPAHLIAAADGIVGQAVRGAPSIALPTRQGSETAIPGDSGRETITLSTASTAAVVAACKARAVSVPSAVHAAVIRVAATYAQHPLAKCYMSFFPIDLRRLLPQPAYSAEYAVGVFVSGLAVCVADVAAKSFDEVLAELAAAYGQDFTQLTTDADGRPVGMVEVAAPLVRRTTILHTTPPPSELPPTQNPDLSSLGVVEKYIQREYAYTNANDGVVEVAGMWMGTQMLPRTLQCHLWTFRDQMTLQGSFNTSYYDGDFVRDVLRKMEAELLHGLGIN